jgi:hypothetical protein
MKKRENILIECITDIKSGKATLNECLDRYPSQRQELEPLLKVALNIQPPPDLQLDTNYKQASKARLLEQIRTTKQKEKRPAANIFSFGLPQHFAWARIPISILIAVILLSTIAGGTAYASQSSLPGDLLYPVKTTTEDVRLFLAGNPSMKAELSLKFAQHRLEEMNQLANKDQSKTMAAVDGYRDNLESARLQIGRITDASALLSSLESAISEIENQIRFCDNILDASPAFLDVVSEADTYAIQGQVQLIERLAENDNIQAAEMNLKSMRNRLQRAQDKANLNQYQLMEQALQQYQQFNNLGEMILVNSQNANQQAAEIEELSLGALPGYLDTLESIYQMVPQEYQESIKVCQQNTLQFQTQARHRYQRQGNPDTGPESSIPTDEGSSNQNENQLQYGGWTASSSDDVRYPVPFIYNPMSSMGSGFENMGGGDPGAETNGNGATSNSGSSGSQQKP